MRYKAEGLKNATRSWIFFIVWIPIHICIMYLKIFDRNTNIKINICSISKALKCISPLCMRHVLYPYSVGLLMLSDPLSAARLLPGPFVWSWGVVPGHPQPRCLINRNNVMLVAAAAAIVSTWPSLAKIMPVNPEQQFVLFFSLNEAACTN